MERAYKILYNSSSSIDDVTLTDIENCLCVDNQVTALKKLRILIMNSIY